MITNKLLFAITLVFLSNILNAQDQDVRTLGTFDKIVVSGNIEVILIKSDEEKLVIVDMDEDDYDMKIVQENKTLKINLLKNLIKNGDELEIFVYYRELYHVKALAGAELTSETPIAEPRLNIKATSGATIELAIDSPDVKVTAGSGAEIELTGTAARLETKSSSGGIIEAYNLSAQSAYVNANTGGMAEINVSDYLEANANTGGIIEYSGNPEKTSFKNFAGTIEGN